MSQYYLYYTLGCHLCDEAEKLLDVIERDVKAFSYEKMDIAISDELVDTYGVRIPVLFNPETKGELNWPFTLASLLDFIHHSRILEK